MVKTRREATKEDTHVQNVHPGLKFPTWAEINLGVVAAGKVCKSPPSCVQEVVYVELEELF